MTSAADEPRAEQAKPAPPPPQGYRYRVTFAKTGALRFIGHLDLQDVESFLPVGPQLFQRMVDALRPK